MSVNGSGRGCGRRAHAGKSLAVSSSTTFAERSLARAQARDAKRAREPQWRQFSLPGSRNFNLVALPPYVELRRHGDGWILRYHQQPRSRP